MDRKEKVDHRKKRKLRQGKEKGKNRYLGKSRKEPICDRGEGEEGGVNRHLQGKNVTGKEKNKGDR